MTLKTPPEKNLIFLHDMPFGKIAVVQDDEHYNYNGRLVMKIIDGYVPIPQREEDDYWDSDCTLLVQVLPEGTECIV